jgi:cyclic dehypoxanthinyl futalosine synthase
MSADRIDREEALRLLADEPLGSLMARAHAVRSEMHPGGTVTFVHDTNPNYTNVCVTGCRFCAFHRGQDDPEAYTLTPGELAERVRAAAEAGATTVLLQGGHHPGQGLADWIAYLRAIREACPEVHIHPFSPPEIAYMAGREKTSTREVLQAIREEGVDTLPGGGAEVLSDRTRSILSPRKCDADTWLEVMEEAHDLGFRTTATLMYGHVETGEEIVEHLFRLRDLQDRTGGFRSFIPWSFKPGRSDLGKDVANVAHPARYVRIIAISRLVLDNFPHVQSSWFSENTTAGQLGLMAGADDFGGVLVEENVLRETGFKRSSTLANVLSLIRGAGFVPARRDSHYRIVETYPMAAQP